MLLKMYRDTYREANIAILIVSLGNSIVAALVSSISHKQTESQGQVHSVSIPQIVISLTHLSIMEFPTLINWTSPFPF